jgi:peptidoglycan/xylan/chitin deacetylase (PgdA/CDA1 family)
MKLFTSLTLSSGVMLSLFSPLLGATAPSVTPVRKPLQFVLLAFDGSEMINRWEETRKFAKDNNTKFTYFVSGVLFIGKTHSSTQPTDMIMAYQGPHKKPGQSDIGFSAYQTGNSISNQPIISQRIEQMNLALQEGHELGSHLNGHFEASEWTASDWDQEFTDFTNLLFNPVYQGSKGTASIDRSGFLKGMIYKNENMIGFRTPYLSQNAALYPVLKKHGFKYDTSKTAQPNYWPEKDSVNGIWNFPLAELTMKNATSDEQARTLSMDYNFYVSQSEKAHRDDPVDINDKTKLAFLKQQMLDTYHGYFRSNYDGNRAPVSIGHHFANWNHGIYWEALKEFAADVCNLKDVRCITYAELVKFMETLTPAEHLAYKTGAFTTEPAALTANPKTLNGNTKDERGVAQVFANEIEQAKYMLTVTTDKDKRRDLKRFITRWENLQEKETDPKRIAHDELLQDHWLNRIEERAELRNQGYNKSYKQLVSEHLGQIPSAAHHCEGGKACDQQDNE